MSSVVAPSSVNDLLDYYKKNPFMKGLLPFRSTVNTLDSPVPLIYAKQDGRQHWVMCEKTTKKPALFSFAATYAQSDHPETGNYVPAGEATPYGVEPKAVQVRSNLKCFYTYIFDTFTDYSLYEGQWAMDTYMSKLPGFNVRDLPRREYLSGHEEKFRARFWMQTPIFLRRGPNETRVPPPGHLHEWVKRVDEDSSVFKANPDRPRLWVKDGSEIVPLADRTPSTLQRGDIVAMSFTVTYHMTSVNWFPQFHPADIIVLKAWDGDATDYSAPGLDLYNRPAPVFDAIGTEAGLCGKKPPAGPSGHGASDDSTGQKVDDAASQAVSSGTLEGEASDGILEREEKAAETASGERDDAKAETEKQGDAREEFEMIDSDGQVLARASDAPPEASAPEGDRRPPKIASTKSSRGSRKARS